MSLYYNIFKLLDIRNVLSSLQVILYIEIDKTVELYQDRLSMTSTVPMGVLMAVS